MKKIYKFSFILFLFIGLTNCTKSENIDTDLEIQNFVWKGLNAYYLWQPESSNLQDSRFATQKELNDFLNGKTPEHLFEGLLFEHGVTDKWSWIVDDYVELEKLFSGIKKTNGMRLGLVRYSEGSTNIFGYVEYVIPNSEAENLGIKRGDFFYAINGEELTVNNYINLLSSNSYTVNFGDYVIDINSEITIVPSNNISINKVEQEINPIFKVTTHEVAGKKIGYVFYKQFTANYDSQLNAAFTQLKNDNVTDLVLDLRHNGGGSVQSAVHLASMITGQFTGELFAKEKWNTKWQSYLEVEHPGWLVNNFTDKLSNQESITHLNLNSVTIIVSENSASASELVINGLLPYINVNLIGTKTHGKFVGSVTLYDSDSYRKNDATLNTNHLYAMQPIVLETLNKFGENNNREGFVPGNILEEDYRNLGQYGDLDEPLFDLAIQKILGLAKPINKKPASSKLHVDSNIDNLHHNTDMYVELK